MNSRFLLPFVVLSAVLSQPVTAQDKKIAVSGYEGMIVTGYVDHGAFLNFAGPSISYKSGSTRVMFGMLPSLRYKEDQSAIKNASVLPVLGVGVSYAFKHMVVQLPLYYNAKTATKDGSWKPGLGIGYRFSQ